MFKIYMLLKCKIYKKSRIFYKYTTFDLCQKNNFNTCFCLNKIIYDFCSSAVFFASTLPLILNTIGPTPSLVVTVTVL